MISSGMREASSALLTDSGMIAQFSNVTGDQSDICLTKPTFYLKLSQGHEPIDMGDAVTVATYTKQRGHGEIYQTNGTITTIYGVNSDGDSLLETGEKFKVVIGFTQLAMDGVDPAVSNRTDLYAHPYEKFRIELRPSAGAVLAIERQIPAVYSEVMTID